MTEQIVFIEIFFHSSPNRTIERVEIQTFLILNPNSLVFAFNMECNESNNIQSNPSDFCPARMAVIIPEDLMKSDNLTSHQIWWDFSAVNRSGIQLKILLLVFDNSLHLMLHNALEAFALIKDIFDFDTRFDLRPGLTDAWKFDLQKFASRPKNQWISPGKEISRAPLASDQPFYLLISWKSVHFLACVGHKF